eukprot:Hpha_TRINITY_DN15456_c0_g1::TRINITY_DN15456_c0_g1_i1::g.176232::m.176232/K08823/CLK; CDC-like kinase
MGACSSDARGEEQQHHHHNGRHKVMKVPVLSVGTALGTLSITHNTPHKGNSNLKLPRVSVARSLNSNLTITAPNTNKSETGGPISTRRTGSKKGHYDASHGEILGGEWEVTEVLGEGTFARVVGVCGGGGRKAVKIVRGVDRYTRDAEQEIEMLEKIRKDDDEDFYPLIKYDGNFISEGAQGTHVCIVFPRLGYSLLTHLDKVGTFSPRDIAHIAWQMGAGLNYLHSHLHAIHTDLKPENILLEAPCERVLPSGGTKYIAPKSMNIRIIDFGGSTKLDHKSSVVSTRPYRAPEVLLRSCWGQAIDVWSTGCILAELHTGKMLLRTGVGGGDREQLAMMEQLLGPMPKSFADCPANVPKSPLFDSSCRLDKSWCHAKPKVFERINRVAPLKLMGLQSDFADLLSGMLTFDPTNRLTAYELMRHPFVTAHYAHAESQTLKVETHEQIKFGEVLGAPSSKIRDGEARFESVEMDSSCGWTPSGHTNSPVTETRPQTSDPPSPVNATP